MMPVFVACSLGMVPVFFVVLEKSEAFLFHDYFFVLCCFWWVLAVWMRPKAA